MNHRPVTILLVEDDKVDVMAIRRSFRELKIANPLIEAGNGVEALERLRGQNGFDKLPSPCLVLLDLNMPRMNGLEFLEEVRHDPDLRRTIIFVMTTSRADEDRTSAYDKNVAGYVLKERAGEAFLDSVRMLNSYWLLVEFPD
jgi:CheY-like chemotaxis protein